MTAPRRAVRRLTLTQFRNYASLDLALDGRPVVLVGPNGAGKTNLIEAVSCLAPGRGLRRAATEEMARRENDVAAGPWAVSAELEADGVSRRLGVGQDPGASARRIARLDGAPATQSDLGRLVRIAWLTPAQDRVFAGPRSDRLKFLDRLTLALAPDHATNASAYERAMRERSKLLEEGRLDADWLDALEKEMAARGTLIAEARADLAVRLQAMIDARPDGPFPKADLALDGALEARLAAGDAPATAEADFRADLAAARRRDAQAGRALSGPHRTDLIARHRAKDMPAGDCSTGEQKALLVGVALAHARALEAAAGAANPLLLLDEAAAHLDADRRAALADEIAALEAQTWATGTDAALFDPFAGRAQLFRVEDGRVEAIAS